MVGDMLGAQAAYHALKFSVAAPTGQPDVRTFPLSHNSHLDGTDLEVRISGRFHGFFVPGVPPVERVLEQDTA